MSVSALILASVLGLQNYTKPYEVLKLPKTPQEFTKDLPAENEGRAWLEGDRFKAIFCSKTKYVSIRGAVEEGLTRFPDTHYWGIQVEYRWWPRAIITYAFLPQFAFEKDLQFKYLRGDEAPPPPKMAAELKGKLTEKEYIAPWLKTHKRKIHIYSPPGNHNEIPFIVMADGQTTADYAKILEPLLDAGKITPVGLIGIESGPYLGGTREYEANRDFRAKEYLRNFDPRTFDAHLVWIIDEIIPMGRKDFGFSSKREETAVYGHSVGGAFAVQAALRYPDKFGVVFSFSTAVPPEEARITGDMPKFFFASGTLESYSTRVKQSYDFVSKRHAEATSEEYIAGHDPAMWQMAFADAIQKAFPAP